jgi:hypothetical protein
MVGWMVGFVNEYAKNLMNARFMGDTASASKYEKPHTLWVCGFFCYTKTIMFDIEQVNWTLLKYVILLIKSAYSPSIYCSSSY